MKIKRLCATNIREAMRKVRDELGPEAVILSNERTEAGFEIVAAVDYDEKLLQEAQQAAAIEAAAQQRTLARDPDLSREVSRPLVQPIALEPNALALDPLSLAAVQPDADEKNSKLRVVWSQDPLLVEMRQEIRVLHQLLEQQLSGLAWGELSRQQPHRTELLSQLLDFGFGPDLCLRLADAVAKEPDRDHAWRLALETLGRGLSVTHDDILTQGGIAALIGPTGVGKTTTIAKLAARYNQRHGLGHVALITTDSYRIGAYEQLCTFGMIMETPVRLVSTAQELQDAISSFAEKNLILIDTAGMSQRDVRLSKQFALLSHTPRIRSYLVLAANAQHSVLRETAAAFAQIPLSGAILTKVDETTRMGAALSVVHEKTLPLAYISNGQRVPEDLQIARIEALIRMGESFAGLYQEGAATDTLALAFGKRLIDHVIR